MAAIQGIHPYIRQVKSVSHFTQPPQRQASAARSQAVSRQGPIISLK
jgi:hypothetical protein